MTTKTRTKGTKETNRTKKMNGTKGKGKEEKQLLRKMRPKSMRTKRKTLLGRGQKTISLGVHFPNSWNSYSSSTSCL